MTYLCVHQSARNLDRRIARLRTILTGIGLGFIVIAAAGSWWCGGALVDRYESHLARSEARNRTLVQNSAPILVVDSAGQILGANPQAEDLFRAPKARLLDMTLRDLWLPDHREKVEDLFRTVASSDVVEDRKSVV